ncbi:hypothetical protein [Psychromonas sp. MME1]|uniref:hypothetical protein n=1 Tax=Psychromonas sp. MME1 TaxID=3231032 RepID=UPI0034E2C110
MSFFKSLFAKKQPLPTRTLTVPNELQTHDIFTFGDSFALPQIMRKQQFQVIDCHTIEFKYDHYAQIIAQGSAEELVYVSFPDNPQKLIKVSLLLTRDEVQNLFDLETFAEIFEEPGNVNLMPLTNDHHYADMVADNYIQQNFMITGYKHRKDYRGQKPPQHNEEEHGREFEYYSLEGAHGKRMVEIYIFENGDTDVYLSFLRPANDIAELWIKGE